MTLSNPTPMIRQYRELKAKHPGTLLFFRLGDFYELFFEDAVIGARELQITLTARHKERGDPIPMCGVPHHSAANYIAKLVRKGYRVAIAEQMEDEEPDQGESREGRVKSSARPFSTFPPESFAPRRQTAPTPGTASPPTSSRMLRVSCSSLLRWRRWFVPVSQERRILRPCHSAETRPSGRVLTKAETRP